MVSIKDLSELKGKDAGGRIAAMVEQLFDLTQDQSRQILDRITWRNILYYCLSEGTEIPLLDGRTVPIEYLVDQGPVWVYGFSLDKLKIIPAMLEKCWNTGEKECVEVFLNNGKSFICTEDHQILTWFGYECAGNLKSGTPLVPFREKYYKQSGGHKGYNQIFQPYDAEWQQTHRMVWNHIDSDYDRRFYIHHHNERKSDNRPENLRLMTPGDHSRLTLKKHKEKIMSGLLAYCATEESRNRKSRSAKRQWKEKRDIMMAALKVRDTNPQKEGIKKYWADPKNQEAHAARMKRRWEEKKDQINCRVIRIQPAGTRRVFDVSVPETSNFALSSGVFAHNCGEQYLTFLHGNFFRPNLPKTMPTPVTNLIKDFVRAVKSMLLNQKLVPKVSPNTNEPEDQKAADLAGKLLTWMDGINDAELADEKEKLVVWICVSGTAFLRTYPDMNSGRWIMTPKGDMRSGEVATRCVYPLSVKMDTTSDNLRAKRWIGLQTLYAKEYVEDIFKIKVDAGEVANLTDYERKMAKFVAQVSPWKGEGLNQQVYEDDPESVLVREVEFKPTKNWPNGRYLVTCTRKTLLDVDRLPIQTEGDDWYYSLTDFHFDYVPGRFWSDAPINDLISAQNDINQIDQLAAVNRKGLGRPRIISPGVVSLEEITSKQQSHAFLAIRYDPLLAGGKEPKIEAGTPLPAQIYEERAIKMAAIQDMSGDPKNIMRGRAPSAASSGIQIDILRETAERGHYPDIDRFNRAMARVYKKRLLVASEVYSDKRMIKIAGRGNRLEILAFRASDLRGNTDVKLELDSGISTTRAGQTTTLIQLAEKGFLGPIDLNPELREEFLSRLGLSGYTTQTNDDIARANAENAAVSLGRPHGLFILDTEAVGEDGSPEVANMDPLFKYDDHTIHFKVHRRFILSGQFSELKQQAQTILLAHADAHQTQLVMEIKQKLEQEQAPQEQLGGPGGGNGGNLERGKTPTGNPMEQTETSMAKGAGAS